MVLHLAMVIYCLFGLIVVLWAQTLEDAVVQALDFVSVKDFNLQHFPISFVSFSADRWLSFGLLLDD
jgi:hypothetical protein